MTTRNTPQWWKDATASVPQYRRAQASAAEDARQAAFTKAAQAKKRFDDSQRFKEQLFADKRSQDMAWRASIDTRNRELAVLRNEEFIRNPNWEREARERLEDAKIKPKVIIPDEVMIHGRKYVPDIRTGRFTEVLTDEEKFLKKEMKNLQRKANAATKAMALPALKPFGLLDPFTAVEIAGGLVPQVWSADEPPVGYVVDAKCGTQNWPINAFAVAAFGSQAALQSVMCLSGQPGGGTLEDAIKATMHPGGAWNILGGYGVPDASGQITRMTTLVGWYRVGQADPAPYAAPKDVGTPFVVINPNYLRSFRADRSRSVPNARRAPEPSPQRAVVIDVGAASPPPPTYRATPTARPTGRVKERKGGALPAILKVVDGISEATEVVDCFYKALPDDTRAKWDAVGKSLKARGPYLDQAGQYGINGADWKARALWHNWHKVDIKAAMKCVAINEVEDQLYGFAHKHKDRVSRARNFKRTLRGK